VIGGEPPIDPIATRTFACALNEKYAQGYLIRHLNLFHASSKLDAAENSKSVETVRLQYVLNMLSYSVL
jgi:hypothetical protein